MAKVDREEEWRTLLTGEHRGLQSMRRSFPTTARLASLASAGELLVSVAAADLGKLDVARLERRTVDVRGRESGVEVHSLSR